MHTPKEKPFCYTDEAAPYFWRRAKGSTEYTGEPETKCGNIEVMDKHIELNPTCKGCARLYRDPIWNPNGTLTISEDGGGFKKGEIITFSGFITPDK